MAVHNRRVLAVPQELYHFLRWSLFRLRWATILVLLVLTAMQPTNGRGGIACPGSLSIRNHPDG